MNLDERDAKPTHSVHSSASAAARRATAAGMRITELLIVTVPRVHPIARILGPDGAERFLDALQRRLSVWVQPSGSVQRLSELTFLALSLEDPAASSTGSAERMQALVESLTEPVELDGLMIVRPVRIGHAPVAGSTDEDVENAVAAALDAVRMLIEQRRFGAIEGSDALSSAARTEADIEVLLSDAIRSGRLRMEYQPEFDLRDGRLLAVEALARWDHPELGTLQAERFVGIAEASGMARELGEWSLRSACAQLAQWTQAIPEADFAVRVNVSTEHLSDPHFPALLDRIVAAESGDVRRLCLEITEHSRSPEPAVVRSVLQEVRELGVTVALDDFGAGRNGLLRLCEMPVDLIKIDRAFVAALAPGSSAAVIVAAMIELAGNLGVDVVAEGIESESTAAALVAAGCFRGQGYHLSPPVTADRITGDFLTRTSRVR